MSISWKNVCCAALLVAALAALSACGFHDDPTPAMNENAVRQALVGKTWTLRRIVARKFGDDPARTLQFKADGTVEGFGGCNGFSGTYALEGGNITFGPLTSAEHKSCGPALDEQEYTFLTILAKVRSLRLDDDDTELILLTENQGEVTLTSGSGGLFW